MALPLAVSALIDKRADLAGDIRSLEQQLYQARANLVHLDATIRLLEPTFKPDVIAPKSKRQRAGWFSEGDLPRTILDIPRTAPEPLTSREVALAVMERRGFSPDDETTLATVESRVNGALRRRRGVVEKVALGPRAVGWKVKPE
jgi:hypothetical protein